jgi:hypothetical protein
MVTSEGKIENCRCNVDAWPEEGDGVPVVMLNGAE